MYKVKICGITSADIIPQLNALTPDYVGFIMTAGFKRSVTAGFVRECAALLSPKIERVGVFVNDDVNFIASLVMEGVIDVVQLHGDEDGEYIRRLKELSPVTVIKSVGVAGDAVMPYPDECDIVLLDAYDRVARGGTGKSVPWRRYGQIDKRIILAGGLTPQNVRAALSAVRPWGVDTSGGVETDGTKDAAKISQFIANVRECDNYE